MHNHLKEKLKAYITINNPDLLLRLENDLALNGYLEERVSAAMPLILDLLAADKPGHAIEELALQQMTAELRPSRYNYILEILKDRFGSHYERLTEIGMLQYVTLELLERCQEVFDEHDFKERNKDSAWLQALIRAKIRDYFTK